MSDDWREAPVSEVYRLDDKIEQLARQLTDTRAQLGEALNDIDREQFRAIDAIKKRFAAETRAEQAEATIAEAVVAMRLHADSCASEDGPFPPDRDDPTYSLNRGSMLGQSAGWRNAAALLERFLRGDRPGPFHCDSITPHAPHVYTTNRVTGVCDGRADLAAGPSAPAKTYPDWVAGRWPNSGEKLEGCCNHQGADEHGCWDCQNTGHAHDPNLPCEQSSGPESMRWSIDPGDHFHDPADCAHEIAAWVNANGGEARYVGTVPEGFMDAPRDQACCIAVRTADGWVYARPGDTVQMLDRWFYIGVVAKVRAFRVVSEPSAPETPSEVSAACNHHAHMLGIDGVRRGAKPVEWAWVPCSAPSEPAACRHCGTLPDADGDHTCPCPHADESCPDHPASWGPEEGR